VFHLTIINNYQYLTQIISAGRPHIGGTKIKREIYARKIEKLKYLHILDEYYHNAINIFGEHNNKHRFFFNVVPIVFTRFKNVRTCILVG